MNYLGLGLAVGGLVIVFAAWAVYLSTIPRGKVPVTPIGAILAQIIGAILAISAISIAIGDIGISKYLIIVIAVIPIMMTLAFFYLLSQRKTPVGKLKVKVGDSILPFKIKDYSGKEFDSKEFLGKRTLFKFYRGGWCPYCSAELKLFESMKGDLDKYKVNVIALSNDNAKEETVHLKRDNLSIRLLSDPDLKIIKQYGVEHHKALGGDTSASTIFGISLGVVVKFKSMAIPTSLLIDEKGKIVWIDQSKDYRLRASKKTVMAAVKKAFE